MKNKLQVVSFVLISIVCLFIFIGIKNALLLVGGILISLMIIYLSFKERINHYLKWKDARILVQNIFLLYRKNNDFFEEALQLLPNKITKQIYEKKDISQKLEFLKQYYDYQPLNIMCCLLIKNIKDETGFYYKLIYYYSEIYFDSKYIDDFIICIKKIIFIIIKTIVCIELIIQIFPAIFSVIDIKRINMIFLISLFIWMIISVTRMMKKHYSKPYFYYRMFSEFCARIYDDTPYKALELTIKNNLKYDKEYSLIIKAYQSKNIKSFYEFYQSHKFDNSNEIIDALYKISLSNNLKSDCKVYIETILNKLYNLREPLNKYVETFDSFTCFSMGIYIFIIYYISIMG